MNYNIVKNFIDDAKEIGERDHGIDLRCAAALGQCQFVMEILLTTIQTLNETAYEDTLESVGLSKYKICK